MSIFFIALLFSLGASAWIYNQFMRRTGGNVKSSLITAAVCGVGLFIILMIVLGLLLR